MRRKERECLDKEYLDEMLTKTEVMTLAFNDGQFPYSVPLSFVLLDGSLYFHCAFDGHKMDCMKRDPHVHFSMYQYLGVDKVKATVCYRSLMGTGSAVLVEDLEEKKSALAALAEKYESKCTMPVPESMLAVTAVVRIDIASLIGKKNEKKPEEGI